MSFLYKKLTHLPLPPKEIIEGVDLARVPETNEVGLYSQRFLINWGNAAHKASRHLRVKYPEFEQWAKENITNQLLDANAQYVCVDPATDQVPTSTGGHTDKTRDFVLLYPILQGGEDAKLTFWQEIGQDVFRGRWAEAEDGSRLKMIDQIMLPRDSWLLINAGVLHGVENLYSTRINLQISFDKDPWVMEAVDREENQ